MDEDFFLGWLASLAESADFNIPVTLNVGGAVFTGELISEDEYFEGIAQAFPDPEEQSPPGSPGSWQEFFKSLPATFDSAMLELLEEGEDPEDVRERRESMKADFIHLKNTRVFTAEERFFGFTGAYWRGKLNSVDGFWFAGPGDGGG